MFLHLLGDLYIGLFDDLSPETSLTSSAFFTSAEGVTEKPSRTHLFHEHMDRFETPVCSMKRRTDRFPHSHVVIIVGIEIDIRCLRFGQDTANLLRDPQRDR